MTLDDYCPTVFHHHHDADVPPVDHQCIERDPEHETPHRCWCGAQLPRVTHIADDTYSDPRGWREGAAAGLLIGGAYLAGAATLAAAAAIAGWWR